MLRIGSLFSGSGGFELAATMCGIEPVWAAEIEPYPIAVTRSRFPNMKHLGSVTDIRGDEIEPVDVITFGSPCQDLSVAGKRAGLKHTENGDDETTRSGLFMEAIRIIKEMREATNGVYPRIAVWENVPGAFSSNKGEDFRIVLEEFIKVVEPTATMPAVPKNGWAYADVYCGDGWSLAYRVLDAQYWGVPQRRRRIFLVADFRGRSAGKISFEREGLRGYFAESGAQREAAAGDAEGGVGTANRGGSGVINLNNGDVQSKAVLDPAGIAPALYAGECRGGGGECYVLDRDTPTYALDQQGGKGGANYAVEVMPTLCSDSHGTPHAVAYSFDSLASNSMKSANPHSGCRQTEVSKCLDTTVPDPSKNQGGIAVVAPIPYTLKIRSGCDVDANGKSGGKGALVQVNKSATLAVAQDQYLFQPVSIENHPADSRVNIDDSGKVQTLTSRMGTGGGNVPMVMEPVAYNGENITSPLNKTNPQPGDPCHTLGTDSRNYLVYCLQGNGIDRADTAGCNGKGWNDETCYTLNTIDRPAVVYAETYQKVTGPLMANSHPGSYTGQDAYNDMFVVGKECPAYSMKSIARNGVPLTEQANPICASDYKDPDIVAHPVTAGVDCRNAVELDEQTNALQAVAGHSLNGNNVVRVRYIVRRLTPTECARLQGFPDEWGHIDQKSDFTDEEYAFWLEVRNTHAAINDKAVKDYTREQMLTWYNKLHTDSSEYKLWGNGVALPCVLYIMEGIAEALNEN